MVKTKIANPVSGKGKQQSKKDKKEKLLYHDNTGEEMWVVEKVLDKKIEASKPLYLIKWKGYSDSDNTWEPLSHLGNIKNLLAQFEMEQSGKDEEEEEKPKSQVDKKSKKIQKAPKSAIKKTQVGKKDATPVKKAAGKTKASPKANEKPKKVAAKKSPAKKTTEVEEEKVAEEPATTKPQKKTKIAKAPKPKATAPAKKAGKEAKAKEEIIDEEVEDDEATNNGTLQNDTAVRISDHAVLDDQGKSVLDVNGRASLKKVYFQVEWKKRNNGVQPAPSFYSYTLLKKKVPGIILDYIENMVHFD